MSTGAKVAIGCAVAAVFAGIVLVVAVGGAAWWLKGKAEQVTGNIVQKSNEIEAYEKKANANPFTEPADGVLSEPRFLKFMEARKAIYGVYERHQADFEAMKDKKEADFSDLTKFAGLVTDIRLSQAKALAAAGMSEDEYRFIQTAVYKSMWAAATVKDTGKQPDELIAEASRQLGEAARELEKVGAAQGLSSTEKEVREAQDAVSELARSTESDSSLSVPPANLELFHKHEADIKKYAMSGLALFGL
jgi:hypothetical protein